MSGKGRGRPGAQARHTRHGECLSAGPGGRGADRLWLRKGWKRGRWSCRQSPSKGMRAVGTTLPSLLPGAFVGCNRPRRIPHGVESLRGRRFAKRARRDGYSVGARVSGDWRGPRVSAGRTHAAEGRGVWLGLGPSLEDPEDPPPPPRGAFLKEPQGVQLLAAKKMLAGK